MRLKTRAVVMVFLAVGFVTHERSQTSNPKDGKIPFSFNKKDFGEVRIRAVKKVNSQDRAVIDKFPIDAPEHTCYDLEVKRALPALDKGPRYFYPAYSFLCLVPTTDSSEKDFANAYPNFSEAIEKLRILLQRKPNHFGQFTDLFDFPYNNAGWSFESRIEYLTFNNISGVFFVTQYNQGYLPTPANNEELTANFQGLTTNEKFYVAARFAITHPSLPRGIDFVDESIQDPGRYMANEEMRAHEAKYLRKEEEKVNNLDERRFQPNLPTIKKLLSSISVK